jgi:hypothetical protein
VEPRDVGTGSNGASYGITHDQGGSRVYSWALADEITAWSCVGASLPAEAGSSGPDILAYKARVMANGDDVNEYAEWAAFSLADYGRRGDCVSLGSGAGRVERCLINAGFAKSFDATDLVGATGGVASLWEKRLRVSRGQLDFLCLDPQSCDFMVRRSVVHGSVNLEHVLEQVNNALKDNGSLVAYE